MIRACGASKMQKQLVQTGKLSAPMGEAIRGILPFFVLLLIVLSIIIFVPSLTLWLPDAIVGP